MAFLSKQMSGNIGVTNVTRHVQNWARYWKNSCRNAYAPVKQPVEDFQYIPAKVQVHWDTNMKVNLSHWLNSQCECWDGYDGIKFKHKNHISFIETVKYDTDPSNCYSYISKKNIFQPGQLLDGYNALYLDYVMRSVFMAHKKFLSDRPRLHLPASNAIIGYVEQPAELIGSLAATHNLTPDAKVVWMSPKACLNVVERNNVNGIDWNKMTLAVASGLATGTNDLLDYQNLEELDLRWSDIDSYQPVLNLHNVIMCGTRYVSAREKKIIHEFGIPVVSNKLGRPKNIKKMRRFCQNYDVHLVVDLEMFRKLPLNTVIKVVQELKKVGHVYKLDIIDSVSYFNRQHKWDLDVNHNEIMTLIDTVFGQKIDS